jgi:hypothetical protein
VGVFAKVKNNFSDEIKVFVFELGAFGRGFAAARRPVATRVGFGDDESAGFGKSADGFFETSTMARNIIANVKMVDSIGRRNAEVWSFTEAENRLDARWRDAAAKIFDDDGKILMYLKK